MKLQTAKKKLSKLMKTWTRDEGEAYQADTEASGFKTETSKLRAKARPRRGVAQSWDQGLETEATSRIIPWDRSNVLEWFVRIVHTRRDRGMIKWD